MTWPYIIKWVLLIIAFVNPVIASGAVLNKDPIIYNYHLQHTIELSCIINDIGEIVYKWTFNETVPIVESAGIRLEEGGVVLRVLRAGEEARGTYACSVGESLAHLWLVQPRPHAYVPPRSDATVGRAFAITCELVGKPYEAVTWNFTKDTSLESVGEALHVGDTSRFSVRDSPAGVPAGTLEGRAATRDDAGKYTCVSPRGGVSASTTLSVTDSPPPLPATPTTPLSTPPSASRSALWPFLGICLEVLVLCAIILGYEKCRPQARAL